MQPILFVTWQVRFFFLNFLSIFYLKERERKKAKVLKRNEKHKHKSCKKKQKNKRVKRKEIVEMKEESPKTLHITIIFLDFGDFAVERVLKLPTTVEKKTSS